MQLTRLDVRQIPGREKNLSWKLNQEMLAQVVGKAKDGASLLRIGGNVYHATSKTPLEQNSSLIVRVAALGPQLALEVVENLRAPHNPNQPSTVVSGHLLEQARRLRRNNLTHLVQIPYQKSPAALQALPGDSMILLNRLKRALLSPSELGKSDRLRPALLNSGLFLESKLSAASQGPVDGDGWFGDDLKALLLRLVNSLGGGGGLHNKGVAHEPYGVTLYRELYHQPIGLRKEVIGHAEEILQKIVNSQYRTVDETDDNWQRWVFELPLYNNQHPDSVPLIIHGEKESSREHRDRNRWGVEFSLRLEQGGLVKARLKLTGSALRIELACENDNLAHRLHLSQDRLRRQLASGGLELESFTAANGW